MSGKKFPVVFSSYITIYFTPTKDGFELHAVKAMVDKELWEPHSDTNYISEEIYVSLYYV